MKTGFEAKSCERSEKEEWKNFLDKNFGYSNGQSYSVDFAPFFEDENLNNSYLIWNEGRIVSSAALSVVTVISQSQTMILGIIGAVATDEAARGQGYSSQVLNELEQKAIRLGCKGLVLWSDQNEFYAKRSFVPVGRQQILSLQGLSAPKKLAEGSPLPGWDVAQVSQLYSQHTARLERSKKSWDSIEKIQSCFRLQWVHNGLVKAYVGFNRGKDMNGIIHEWGGEPEALHSLVWVLLQSKPELLWLTHPTFFSGSNASDPIAKILVGNTADYAERVLLDSNMALFKKLDGENTDWDVFWRQAWFWGLDSL